MAYARSCQKLSIHGEIHTPRASSEAKVMLPMLRRPAAPGSSLIARWNSISSANSAARRRLPAQYFSRRISFRISILSSGPQHFLNGEHHAFEILVFTDQLLSSGGRQFVEARAPVVFRSTPFGIHPTVQ